MKLIFRLVKSSLPILIPLLTCVAAWLVVPEFRTFFYQNIQPIFGSIAGSSRTTVVEDQYIRAEITSYVFRTENSQSPEAIEYDLQFQNKGSSEIEVELNLEELQARDNTSIEYGDVFAVLKDFYDRGTPGRICNNRSPYDWSILTQTFTVKTTEPFIFNDLHLNRVGVEDCGVGQSRVDFDTDWIDIEWIIRYRVVGTNERGTLNLEFRLNRNN